MLSDDDDDGLCGAALADTDSDEEPQACDEVAVESSSSSESSSESSSSSSSGSSASSPLPSTVARGAQEAGEERRRCGRQEALPLFKGAMAKLKAAAAAAASGSERSTAAGLALQAAAQLELFLRFLDGKAVAAAEAEELHAACDLLGGGAAVREALPGLVASDEPFDAKTTLSALLSWRLRLFQEFDSEEHAFRADEASLSAVGQPVSHGGRKRLLTSGPKRPLF